MSVLLTATCAVPAAGAIVTAALPAGTSEARRRTSRMTALGFSAATLVLAAVIAARFHPGGPRYQLTESYSWIRTFGIDFSFGVDGIGAALVLLTAVLVPLVMLASWHDADPAPSPDGTFENRRRTQGFFALILAVEAMVLVSFLATDIFLFYVFFEAMLIPMYFLIGGFGDQAGGPEQAGSAPTPPSSSCSTTCSAAW